MGSCLSGDGPAALLPPSGKRKDRRKLRRNRALPSSSYESVDLLMELRLQRVPGRMCSNGCSDFASLFSKQGRKGVNQDAMIVWEDFGSKEGTTCCGVFDGHGPYGHFVAKKVRTSLPLKLSSMWELISNSKNGLGSGCNGAMASPRSEESPSTPTLTRSHSDKQKEIFSTWKDSFVKAFRGQDLVIGNIGDSRAVLGTRDGDNRYIAVQLTVDLMPSVPREAERIRLCKGRVFALKCEPKVPRVWLPTCDSPGLAMARAFGDFCLKDFGLISVPEVSHHRISEKDEFVVLATDGIWDVLSNSEVVNIVASAPRFTAARALVETAVRVWRSKFPASMVDDCAVVCLFLNPDTTSMYTEDQKKLLDIIKFSCKNSASAPPASDHSGASRKSPEDFTTKSQ